MSSPETSQTEWKPCQPGDVSGLVNSLARNRQRRTLKNAIAVSAVLLVFAAGVTFSVSQFWGQSASIPKIACKRVHELAEQFVSHELDKNLERRVERHLSHCGHCRDHFAEQFPDYSLPEAVSVRQTPPEGMFANTFRGR